MHYSDAKKPGFPGFQTEDKGSQKCGPFLMSKTHILPEVWYNRNIKERRNFNAFQESKRSSASADRIP